MHKWSIWPPVEVSLRLLPYRLQASNRPAYQANFEGQITLHSLSSIEPRIRFTLQPRPFNLSLAHLISTAKREHDIPLPRPHSARRPPPRPRVRPLPSPPFPVLPSASLPLSIPLPPLIPLLTLRTRTNQPISTQTAHTPPTNTPPSPLPPPPLS